MTERMRSQVQASEMRFLRKIEGVTLFNKVRSSEIRKSLNIEPLLLRIERPHLRSRNFRLGRLGDTDYAPGLLSARTFMRQDFYEPEVKKIFFIKIFSKKI